MSETSMDIGQAFNTSEALEFLKQGKKISRIGWNGKSQYVVLSTPDQCMEILPGIRTLPYAIFVNGKTNLCQVGWLMSQSDMLANDWYIVN